LLTRSRQRYPEAALDALFPGSTQTVFLNLTKPPLDNLKLRQAVAHSLNRATWAKAFGVLHAPMWGVAPEQFYGGLKESDVPAELRYDYDPEKAKRLLVEAGFPDGVTINAYASERGDYKTNTLLLQDQFRKVGINLDVRFVDHPTYHADAYKDTNTLVTISTTQPPNVIPVLRTFYASDAIVTKAAGGGRNYSHYGEVVGSIDEALAKAEVETDSTAQLTQLRDIQLQILRDLPVLRLQALGVLWVRQPWVKLPFEPKAGLGHYSLAGVQLTK
jgi:peptide/nickel transport system substrate-binding protein